MAGHITNIKKTWAMGNFYEEYRLFDIVCYHLVLFSIFITKIIRKNYGKKLLLDT